MSLDVRKLWIMQQTIRDLNQIPEMVKYVKNGGLWDLKSVRSYADENSKKSELIYISLFPDGKAMIHDGHHRILASYLGDKYILQDSEYIVKSWTYESYNKIVFETGYVTPFNPLTECRLNDFWKYKNIVLQMAKEDPDSAVEYIVENKSKYAEPRFISSVNQLALQHYKQIEKVA